MREVRRKSATPPNHHSPWTLQEIEFVEKHYGSRAVREIADSLGRSVNGIRRMIKLLGLVTKQDIPWTDDDIAVLRAHYDRGRGIERVRSLLPHRTKGAIFAYASKLGLTGRERWSEGEKRFLAKHYGPMSAHEIAAALGRSVGGVRRAVNLLHLGKKQSGIWREPEMAILDAHYNRGAGLAYVQRLLPGRSRAAITAQASKMGITRERGWSPEEEQILRTYYPVMGIKVADKLPQRTKAAIKGRVQFLGLRVHRQTFCNVSSSDRKINTGS